MRSLATSWPYSPQFPQNALPILLVERLRFSHGSEDNLGAPRVMTMAF